MVADPHFSTFEGYRFEFQGEGAYKIFQGCGVTVQSFECSVTSQISYVYAVGVQTGEQTLLVEGDKATLNGTPLSTTAVTEISASQGTNFRVKPYTPSSDMTTFGSLGHGRFGKAYLVKENKGPRGNK